MKIPKQARRDARQLFRACVADGKLDENRARQVVRNVVQQKPRGYVAILSHFERLIKLELARRTARVESATVLTPQFQGQVQAELTRQYGPGLNFIFTQNPALIGGMRVQVGGDVYDGSVESRLRALQQSF
ncbi:MAG TPA: F0F1 ATP synthase subunit delta [Verrucomicrobiae bacterium]|jgi:F-type H+-transporting ATPase subunit delta|nr:F0F1 ATP synthase subunit delta [Verrucomicrobiae bacterium]